MWTLPTFDWPQQKARCLSCAHCTTRPDNPKYGSPAIIMLCKINPSKGFRGIGSCSHCRVSGPCGPDAKLWEAKNA